MHEEGVLHRDIKPSNVLMEGRAPILIDFGLARVADDPKLTHTGWLLGTPGYLAPEILYGDDATRPPTCTRGPPRWPTPAPARPPFGRGPSMAIMDRVRRGEHDLSGLAPTRASGGRGRAPPGARSAGPRSTRCSAGCAAGDADGRAAPHRRSSRTDCRTTPLGGREPTARADDPTRTEPTWGQPPQGRRSSSRRPTTTTGRAGRRPALRAAAGRRPQPLPVRAAPNACSSRRPRGGRGHRRLPPWRHARRSSSRSGCSAAGRSPPRPPATGG